MPSRSPNSNQPPLVNEISCGTFCREHGCRESRVSREAATYPRLQGYWGNQALTRSLSCGSWDLRYPLPKIEKPADLAHYFSGVAKFCVQKNIERERVNLRSEPDFYWGNSPVNFKVQNLGGESFPLSPVVDTPMSLRKVAHPIRRYAERYAAQNDGGSLTFAYLLRCAKKLQGCKNKMSKHFHP